MSNYLAVDLGASSYRVILNDEKDSFELFRGTDHLKCVDDKKYWNITTVYNSLIDVLLNLNHQKIDVTAVSISSWGCDFVYLSEQLDFDSSGKLKNQIYGSCYLNYQKKIPSELISDKKLFKLTGIKTQEFNTINRYQQISEPITFIASYINYLLTGYIEADYTIASTTQLLDKVEDKYNIEVLEKVGIDRNFLPDLKPAGNTIKKIQHPLFNHINVIFGAGHDTAYALNHKNSNSLILNIGSWIIIGTNLQEVKQYNINYSYERGIKTKYKVVVNQQGMLGYNTLVKNAKLQHEELYELLKGAKNTYQISSLNLNPDDYKCSNQKEVNIASYLSDLAKLTTSNIKKFIKDINPDIDNIYIVGGGSKNRYFIDKLKVLLPPGLTIEFGPEEATVVGNLTFQKEIMNGITKK